MFNKEITDFKIILDLKIALLKLCNPTQPNAILHQPSDIQRFLSAIFLVRTKNTEIVSIVI